MTTQEDPGILGGSDVQRVGQMSAHDVTTLVSIFQNMLDRTERRIVERLDQNSAGASERWALHEREHGAVESRLTTGEAILTDHIAKSTAIWSRVHEQEVAEAARIAPVKGAFAWLWANWRTLVLLVVAVLAALSFTGDTLGHLLGLH